MHSCEGLKLSRIQALLRQRNRNITFHYFLYQLVSCNNITVCHDSFCIENGTVQLKIYYLNIKIEFSWNPRKSLGSSALNGRDLAIK